MNPRSINRWLIVRSNGVMRVAARRPTLRYIELSIPEETVIVRPEGMEGVENE